jgi:3-oxoacyl-[acyl-carrier protein] reductase
VVLDSQERRVIEGEAKVKVLRPREEREASGAPRGRLGAVVVSGSSRGIGAAIARELAGNGYPVVVNYVKGEDAARAVVDDIVAAGGQALACQADVRDETTVERMVARAIGEYGALAGVVNNACPPIAHREFGALAWTDFATHVDVQLRGAFNVVHAALPAMVERQAGVIVNIGSIFADNVPPVKVMPYSVAKAALAAFTKALAVEYGPKGIRVNCVSPGMTETDLSADVPERTKAVTRVQTPLRRLATPADIAGVVAFLFSDKAAHVTGQNVRVCGGIVMA